MGGGEVRKGRGRAAGGGHDSAAVLLGRETGDGSALLERKALRDRLRVADTVWLERRKERVRIVLSCAARA